MVELLSRGHCVEGCLGATGVRHDGSFEVSSTVSRRFPSYAGRIASSAEIPLRVCVRGRVRVFVR